MQDNKVSEGFTCFARAFEKEPESSRAGILLALALKQVKRCDSVKKDGIQSRLHFFLLCFNNKKKKKKKTGVSVARVRQQ